MLEALALASVCEDNADNQEKAGGAGAIEAVVAALRTHGGNADVQRRKGMAEHVMWVTERPDGGRGFDLTLYSVYFDLQVGRFGLMSEYLTADVEKGVSATRDAKPKGFFIMPTLYLNETIEAVVRYTSVNSDGRGLQMGDVMRFEMTPHPVEFEMYYSL